MPTEIIQKADFIRVCRICLQKDNLSNFNIHESEIFHMFQYCINIDINENDGLPNQICQNCFTKLTDSFQFKQLCETSHRVLLEIRDENDTKDNLDLYVKEEVTEQTDIKLPLIKNDSDCDEDDVQDIVGNDNVEEEDVDEEEQSCDDEWLSDRIENSKTKRSQLDPNKCDPKTLICKSCNKKLSTVGSLLRHLRLHESKRYCCGICKKGFYEERHFNSHMKRHKNETRYKCDYCDEEFYEINTLTVHVTKKHDTEPPLLCTVCNKTFRIKLKFDLHQKVHSTEKNHICSVCGKGFFKRHLLRKHQKHHATERIYHCMQCEKSFRVEATLRLHYKRCHSGEKKKEVCTICGKAVLNIKAHLNTHTNEKPFKCTECPKEFSNKYNLEEHRKRKHGDPQQETKRPYLCSICGKGSVSTTALKTHFLHMHTVGKRYPCPICNKKFKTDKAVNAHVRYTHNDERRYACTVCSKSFQTSTILKIHMRVHTGERPFVCKLCNKAFGQASTLKTHMKVHGFEHEKMKSGNDLTSPAMISTTVLEMAKAEGISAARICTNDLDATNFIVNPKNNDHMQRFLINL